MTFHRSSFSSRPSGFSLIEIMIAVVVLATGLLALAALQGALARNSADAKARSAIMAALNSRMNDIRQSPPAAGKTWTTADAWVGAAASQAGTSALQVVETVASWKWNGTGYVTTAVTKPTSVFTRASLEATWTAANGDSKSLGLSSDVSGKIYGAGNGYPIPDPTGSASKKPIIRQANPSNTPGVIPLVSGSQATAASNPQPLKLGAQSNKLIGTAFDVLNYVPEGTTAKIIKRFQTEVIKCRCKYGIGTSYSVAGTAQWPAVWDGVTYTTYKGTGDPAGKSANAGQDTGTKKNPIAQSAECTECCRDHHDPIDRSVKDSLYDPEATATGKYNEASGVLTATSSDAYVAACRVVKVDGIWKTAADMYLRSYGLLETKSDSLGVQAKSGVPSDDATLAYAGSTTVTGYVKDYLSNYTGESTTAPGAETSPTLAQTLFDSSTLGNTPPTVFIKDASDTDGRYLHARGLYVDYLSAAARKAVGAAISACSTQSPSKALAECILPVLPFTTINLTEMASWIAEAKGVIDVNTDKALNWNVDKPSGGRTWGNAKGEEKNTASIRISNSGVAVSDDIPGAVDDRGDKTAISDYQTFKVGSGDVKAFYVAVTDGDGQSTSKPNVTSNLSTPGTGCSFINIGTLASPNYVYSCKVVPPNTLPATGMLTLKNYFRVQRFADELFTFPAGVCASASGGVTFPGGNYAVPGGGLPKLKNQLVYGVAVNGTPLTGPWDASRNTGLATEETDIANISIPAPAGSPLVPAKISVTLQDQTEFLLPTVASCTFTDTSPIAIISVVWNEAWAN